MPEPKLIAVTVLGLLIKWVFLKWVSQKAVAVFNFLVDRYLIKYPRAWAMRIHYKKKKQGLGHQYPNPVICPEEGCKNI